LPHSCSCAWIRAKDRVSGLFLSIFKSPGRTHTHAAPSYTWEIPSMIMSKPGSGYQGVCLLSGLHRGSLDLYNFNEYKGADQDNVDGTLKIYVSIISVVRSLVHPTRVLRIHECTMLSVQGLVQIQIHSMHKIANRPVAPPSYA
jgi:hypothetical protein